jgi:hypothetical protein
MMRRASAAAVDVLSSMCWWTEVKGATWVAALTLAFEGSAAVVKAAVGSNEAWADAWAAHTEAVAGMDTSLARIAEDTGASSAPFVGGSRRADSPDEASH